MGMPVGGYGVAGMIRCVCGNEARVVASGVGAYVICHICGAGTYMCNDKEDAIKMFQETYGLEEAKGTEVLAFARYQDLERAADRTAVKIKEGFMEMGYILKVARDTDILDGSGYAGHEEFAEKRYGLDKGTVSRYIRIVERFSVGGNSHVLQDGYRNIGFAKLSLMLHMPDAIAEEITESYSKQEVQAIKEEIDAEHAVSDIEVAIEAAQAPEPEREGSLLERAVRQLGREQPALYHKLHDVYTIGGIAAGNMVMDVLAPQGDAVYMVRVPGTGRLMLSLSGDAASVTNVRSCEKERCSAEDVQAAVASIMHPGPVKGSWQQEYGEPMEPLAEAGPGLATDGRGTGEALPQKRKESKVVKAVPPKATEKGHGAGRPTKVTADEAHPEPEEQLPGQMKVADYPEAIPDARFEEIVEAPPAEAAVELDGEVERLDASDVDEAAMAIAGRAAGAVDAATYRDASEHGEDEEAAVDAALRREEPRMGIRKHMDRLQKYFTIWDGRPMPIEYLEKAYQNAIDLAADLERLLDMKEKEGTDG